MVLLRDSGPGGGIGRRMGLKIPGSRERAGSSPAPGTSDHAPLPPEKQEWLRALSPRLREQDPEWA